MLKNKVDKLVLKALLELEAPAALNTDPALKQRCWDELRSLANRLLMSRDEGVQFLQPTPISKEDKAAVNSLITRLPDGEEKRDMVFFYRLAVLVETILQKYRK